MSRKYYELLARLISKHHLDRVPILNDVPTAFPSYPPSTTHKDVIDFDGFIKDLCLALYEDNPNFDEVRFCEACGLFVNEEVQA